MPTTLCMWVVFIVPNPYGSGKVTEPMTYFPFTCTGPDADTDVTPTSGLGGATANSML